MIPLRDDNPTELPPVFVVSLIVVCVLVFLWQLSLGDGMERAIHALGVVPAALFDNHAARFTVVPPEATILTSMFLHGGLAHLGGNMLYLWIFGNNVEDALGHVRFLIFYLVCGIAAVFAQALPNPDSTVPMIGASGAISGVLGAYVLLYPRARVLVGIPFGFYLHMVTLRAVWVLGIWFAMQVVSSLLAAPGEAGIAFLAHAGGFVAGMVLVPFMRRPGVQLFHRERQTRSHW